MPPITEEVLSFNAHSGVNVTALSFTADGRRLATSAKDGLARVWDTATGECVAEVRPGGGRVTSAISSDGRWIAAAASDEVVSDASTCRLAVWDLSTGQPAYELAGHEGRVNALAWSPDGRTLASAGVDHTVRLWRAGDVAATDDAGNMVNRPQAVLEGHRNDVAAVQFSPNGSVLASAAGVHGVNEPVGEILLWDVRTGRKLYAVDQIRSYNISHSLSFSPDGDLLAFSSNKGPFVGVWNLRVRRLVHEVPAGQDVSAAFLPDGRLATGAWGTAHLGLWDVSGRQPVGAVSQPYFHQLMRIAASPARIESTDADELRVAAGYSDGVVKLFRIESAPTTRKSVSQQARDHSN